MIDIKIKYVKKLEPYALNRSKEKYINEEIKEKKNKEHTQILLDESFLEKFDEVVEIVKTIFNNTFCVFYDDYQKKTNYIKIIITRCNYELSILPYRGLFFSRKILRKRNNNKKRKQGRANRN